MIECDVLTSGERPRDRVLAIKFSEKTDEPMYVLKGIPDVGDPPLGWPPREEDAKKTECYTILVQP